MATNDTGAEGRDVGEGDIRGALEGAVEEVASPEEAERVIEQVERLAGGTTEQEAGEKAGANRRGAATAVTEAVVRAPTPTEAAAAALTQTAAEVSAPEPEAGEALAVAQETFAPGTPAPPAVRRGRTLLRDAILHRMGLLQGLDARVYLAINEAPHPKALDVVGKAITIAGTGGWIWSVGVWVAGRTGVHEASSAPRLTVPVVAAATWIVEHPIKKYFRRRRPFIEIVRALVIGTRPGSWSFPSGHTAASFAGATVVTSLWPRGAPVFFSLASLVGFSRVYVGAHYPGDVLTGAVLGTVLADAFRRIFTRLPGMDGGRG